LALHLVVRRTLCQEGGGLVNVQQSAMSAIALLAVSISLSAENEGSTAA